MTEIVLLIILLVTLADVIKHINIKNNRPTVQFRAIIFILIEFLG